MIKLTKCKPHIDKLNHFDLYVLFIKATQGIMKLILLYEKNIQKKQPQRHRDSTLSNPLRLLYEIRIPFMLSEQPSDGLRKLTLKTIHTMHRILIQLKEHIFASSPCVRSTSCAWRVSGTISFVHSSSLHLHGSRQIYKSDVSHPSQLHKMQIAYNQSYPDTNTSLRRNRRVRICPYT